MRIAETRFEVSPGVVHRQELLFDQGTQNRAGILALEDPLGRGGERGEFGFTGADEFDIANLNQNIGNTIENCLHGTVRFAHALVFHVPGNGFLDQHRLQYIGDLFGQAAG